uniref:Uncharacterized protein n=1 Tax=Zea mays TaxID=4577 RepID=A0A804PS01_MAIZE
MHVSPSRHTCPYARKPRTYLERACDDPTASLSRPRLRLRDRLRLRLRLDGHRTGRSDPARRCQCQQGRRRRRERGGRLGSQQEAGRRPRKQQQAWAPFARRRGVLLRGAHGAVVLRRGAVATVAQDRHGVDCGGGAGRVGGVGGGAGAGGVDGVGGGRAARAPGSHAAPLCRAPGRRPRMGATRAVQPRRGARGPRLLRRHGRGRRGVRARVRRRQPRGWRPREARRRLGRHPRRRQLQDALRSPESRTSPPSLFTHVHVRSILCTLLCFFLACAVFRLYY